MPRPARAALTVLSITVLLAALAGCGAPEYTYVANSDRGT